MFLKLKSKPLWRITAVIFLAILSLAGLAFLATILISQGQDRDSLLVCGGEAKWHDCQLTTGKFSYDPMDGMFVVSYLNIPDQSAVKFSGTSCWVKPEGSWCQDSTTGKNETGFDKIIIPLAPRHFW